MTLNIQLPENTVMKPEITVFGVGGAGGNATNNMIKENLEGVNFVIANTDAQALANSVAERRIQLGQTATQGLGAGASPEVGASAAEEAMEQIQDHLKGSNMVFITAGMGGGTGTGAAPVIARAAREAGILTVGVVTKPFHFEGPRRMKIAEAGLEEMQKHVDTLIVIPNQNLFRIANEKTTFADAFKLADNVLHRGVRGVTDLMVMPGLINLDFADVKAVMSEMGKAMMGTGEAEGDRRAQDAAEAAISNPLLDNVSMKGARGVLINITGGMDMTLFEVDEAANRIREEVDPAANIIFGSTFNEALDGKIRVSVVATGIDSGSYQAASSGNSAAASTLFSNAQNKAAQEEAEIVNEDSAELQEDAVEEEFASCPENDFASEEDSEEYLRAVENLNKEYQAKLANVGIETESSVREDVFDGFVPKPAVKPSKYAENAASSGFEQGLFAESFAIDEIEEEDFSSNKPASAKTGGLFSRMARAARSLQSGEQKYTESVGSDVAVAERDDDDDNDGGDDDIPAFLRRKV